LHRQIVCATDHGKTKAQPMNSNLEIANLLEKLEIKAEELNYAINNGCKFIDLTKKEILPSKIDIIGFINSFSDPKKDCNTCKIISTSSNDNWEWHHNPDLYAPGTDYENEQVLTPAAAEANNKLEEILIFSKEASLRKCPDCNSLFVFKQEIENYEPKAILWRASCFQALQILGEVIFKNKPEQIQVAKELSILEKEKFIINQLNSAIGRESKFIYQISGEEIEKISLSPQDFGGLNKTNGYYYNKETGRIISIGRYQNSMDGGKVIEVPNSISDLMELRFLILCGDYSSSSDPDWCIVFDGLPNTIGNLKELRKIDFTGNFSNTLPDSLVDLKKLEILDLSSNAYTVIPPVVLQLLELKTLSFNGCKLSSIPSTIDALENLKALALSYNQITNLPSTIGNLSNLEWLAISNNKIESLPLSLLELKNLKEIILDKKCWVNSNKTNDFVFEKTFSQRGVQVNVY
jgi:hypothetical protein